jgi:N6-L-threonylcarbamoyladenine synthase
VRARLRAVSDEAQLPLVCPPARLCVDNGVMVAWAGLERLALNVPEFLEPPPSLAQVRAL